MSTGESVSAQAPELENFKTEFGDLLRRYCIHRGKVRDTKDENIEEVLLTRLIDELEKISTNNLHLLICILNDVIEEVYAAQSSNKPREYANALVREAFILKGKVFDIIARGLKIASVIDTTKENTSKQS